MSTSRTVPAALLWAALALSVPTSSQGAQEPKSLTGLGTLASEKTLGCVVGEKETTFRIFAPRATAVTLVLFERHDEERGAEHDMRRDEDGVWEATLPGRLYGAYYGYRVAGPEGPGEMFDPSVVIADPYSRAVATKNSFRHPGRTLILDTSYDWEGDTWVAPADHTRLVIYEMHLRDATVHPTAGAAEPGTYRGLVDPKQKGGIAHLKRLGVNAVEFLPLHDFGNIEIPYKDPDVARYGYPINTWNPYERNHWGYMTSYFFAPESYYASDGTIERNAWNGVDGRAVREMKDMIKALHREKIAVILDVVYNHVSQYDQNPFKYADKFYYFHVNPDGTFRGDSGTGNDFRTERPMARRMIVDSVRYWMTEYHVDGFRFDLAAMIDWETCKEIVREARKINPNVVIIAEPWGGGKYDPAGFSDIGWAAWNDQIRNGVKGRNPHGPVPKDGPGFIFGRHEGTNTKKRLQSYVTGTLREDGGLFLKPEHSINYLESHDDNTMGDYIRMVTGEARYGERVEDERTLVRVQPKELAYHKLAAAFLFTSQGPVMIHQGQEFARSKIVAATHVEEPKIGEIDHNSYEKDNETNWINYQHVELNQELFDYYRGLIRLRQLYPAFGGSPKSAIGFRTTRPSHAIVYTIEGAKGERFLVALNGQPHRSLAVSLPAGQWEVLVDATAARPDRPLGVVSKRTTVPPTSALVLRHQSRSR